MSAWDVFLRDSLDASIAALATIRLRWAPSPRSPLPPSLASAREVYPL